MLGPEGLVILLQQSAHDLLLPRWTHLNDTSFSFGLPQMTNPSDGLL